ncbi:MAG: hypothetical protein PVI30_06275 [Myxococcales bacterium]|jgi:hypothetical protein
MSDPRPPSELSDEELLEEVRRRRRARGVTVTDDAEPGRLSATQRAQLLANLELDPDAKPGAIERAYLKLRNRYTPYAEHEDPERRDAARELLQQLDRSYERLMDDLKRMARRR